MIIYPAIDIKNGNCVRLTQGRADQEKVYFKNPEEVAVMWQKKGARFLHVVDLDGAFEGEPRNIAAIEKIVAAVVIPVQAGGGIRTMEAVHKLFDMGVTRVILGTKALQDKNMLKEAVGHYGSKIIVSIDAHNGLTAIDGWTKTSEISAVDFAREVEKIGVDTVVYTDIARDGMLQGPNFESIEDLKNKVNVNIIASGGVSSLEDIKALKKIGVAGAIVGKALYEGKFDLEEAEVE